jgi:extracellular factor (EF) 3-hydroxypalmitic acid methyl ester biosynthesis protein
MDIYKSLNQIVDSFCDELIAIEKHFLSGIPIEKSVYKINESIRKSCAACADLELYASSDLKKLQTIFQNKIEPFFSQSWYMNRALTKPRGYPGDFEILEGIYDQTIFTPVGIGRLLDYYFLHTDLARAVMGRKNYCISILEKYLRTFPNPAILDIACGPCRELREIDPELMKKPFSFHGMDNDQDALAYAKEKAVEAGIPDENLRFTKQNVLRLINPENNIRLFGRYDLIYSVGLYDYLPDDILIRILNGTLAMLKENGEYVVAFKDCNCYDKTEYQWHVDWHFFQRTEEECCQLINKINPKIARLERDESGVILFFTLKSN